METLESESIVFWPKGISVESTWIKDDRRVRLDLVFELGLKEWDPSKKINDPLQGPSQSNLVLYDIENHLLEALIRWFSRRNPEFETLEFRNQRS